MKRTPAPSLTAKRRRLLWFVAAAGLIPTLIFARYCSSRSTLSVDPTISIERKQDAESQAALATAAEPTLPDDGEVYRTADRLREASALALGTTLRAATAQAERRTIHNAAQLIEEVTAAGLLPPQVTADRSMALHSDRSSLVLRYRSKPLAIEILSFPRSREDGPALMVRIPSSTSDADRGSIFIADRLGEIAAPEAFCSVADCVRAGWIDQPFNLAEVPEAQWQQLRGWLAIKRTR